jgi:Protein of unknown function, DUF485
LSLKRRPDQLVVRPPGEVATSPVCERSSFGWTLTIIMLVTYFGFILLVAFGKRFLATKIGGDISRKVRIVSFPLS